MDDATRAAEEEPFVIDLNMAVPPQQQQEAVLYALEERDSNAPDPDAGGRISLAVARNRLWEVGKRLRVRFLDARRYSDPQRRIQLVMDTANEWTQQANLSLELSEDQDAELRVAFNPHDGCWSYIGTDAKTQARTLPTINLSILGWDKVPSDYSKYVLHEFGHAIGCIHEHSTPIAGIKWNRPVVYEYYKSKFDWDKPKVDFNVFQVFAQASSNHGAGPNDPIVADYTPQMDKDSIMVYPIPKEHTLDGYSVQWRGALSAMDKKFIAVVYPKE